MYLSRFTAALALLALPAAAQDLTFSQVELIKSGSAPTIQEIQRAHPPTVPTAYGDVREVINRTPEWLLEREPQFSPADPLLGRGSLQRLAPAASLSFEGYSNADNGALFGFLISPPDTEGDVGINYYVQYNNLGWEVFDKATGASVGGPFAGNSFWQGFGGFCDTDNAGDPIVLFDHLSGEWIFSQFTSSGNPDGHQCFAVSQGGSPFGPYLLYDFLVSPGAFNDYPKISLWPDGLYMTTNEFAGSFAGVNITAFDRVGLLTGTGSAVQVTLPFTGLAPVRFSLQPAHLEGGSPAPAAGTCNLIVQSFDDDTWGNGGGPDGYQFWEFCPDYTTPANSTFTTGPFVTAPAFNFGLTSVPQPGTAQALDPLGQFTMYRFGTRAEGGNLVGAIAHTVDVGGGRNGIRWTTFDLPSLAGVSITDTGTHAPGSDHRWVPSATLDSAGNLGMVYTRSSGSTFPSVYFNGRESTDPAGTLQSESICIGGTGSQLGSSRWGDYASASVDPVDSCTFWVTNEYVETTGTVAWTSRVCSYKFASCGDDPPEPVTVTFSSIAAQDGWVRESSENSGVGNRNNSTAAGRAALRAGDNGRDRQWKTIVSFDTSSIPAGATIQSATLSLTRGRVVGLNPFTSGFAPLNVDISTGGFNGNPALENADFQAPATASAVATLSNAPADGDLSTGTLNAAGLAAISTSSETQFRLEFALDDNDNNSNDYMGWFSANNSNASLHPTLTVTYLP